MQPPKELFMPEAEAAYLKTAYKEASIILEYGAGGSTEYAATLGGKLIFSVESDLDFSNEIRSRLWKNNPNARVVVHHANIGKTGAWGRPINDRCWRRFPSYPMDIWNKPYFRHPDLVLIDGRMRLACISTLILCAKQPIRVLFDDYTVRPLYSEIEHVISPVHTIGRMAEFVIEPGIARTEDIGILVKSFFAISLDGITEEYYQRENGYNPTKAV